MLCEYDDYGYIQDPTSLVDLFVTIDLNQKGKMISAKRQRSILDHVDERDIFNSLMDSCTQLSEKYNIHKSVVLLLLENNKWDPELTQELWLTNPSTILAQIGLTLTSSKQDPSFRHPMNDGTCEVCFCDYPAEELCALPCGHFFCKGCWKANVESMVDRGQTRIMCMQDKCLCRVPLMTVSELTSKSVYENLIRYAMDQQIAQSTSLTNCPNPKCSQPLYKLGGKNRLCNVLKCAYCKFEFCLDCQEKSHAPCSCIEESKWKMFTDENLMEQRLFSEKMKKCPSCHAIIEKNEGCNHMTCFKCHYQFCWLCMGEWSRHAQTFYECKNYNPNDDPYLKKPDDINPQFLSMFNDQFIKRQAECKKYETKRDDYIQKIKDRISRDAGIDSDQINDSVMELVDQMIWSNSNLMWTQALLFLRRWNQFQNLHLSIPQQVSSPPPPPSSYILIENAFKDLTIAVDTTDKLITNIYDNKIPNLPLKEIYNNSRKINVFRQQLLKQCDPLYNSNK